tara:strand:+ start:15791 stop:17686 length:1896 start_codon:yes stop_codon:yes gene_type:complete
MEYRREIDGLRTVAVLPVVLFHAGLKPFSGGYVGVDIFFVISGYLITTILLEENRRGTFSILNFYERRARRILPALFFIMALSVPPAFLLMPPGLLKDFSQSLVAVAAFGANILFYLEADYFAATSELKPLLHTWSLAVEEQYYLFFPLLLALIFPLGRRWTLVMILVLTASSLGLAVVGAQDFPTANFFLLPTRAWELLFGSIAAWVMLEQGERLRRLSPELRSGLTIAGLAMIVATIFLYDEHTPFPSLYAVPPVLGAAMIILFASGQCVVSMLLSLKPMVRLGLISYSLYLWHQPVFAFLRLSQIEEASPLLLLASIPPTILAAWLTWRYIEAPFRHKKTNGGTFGKAAIFTFSLAGIVGFIVLGAVGHLKDGFEGRSDLSRRLAFNYGLDARCAENREWNATCVTEGLSPGVAIWGDSFSMHLVEGLLTAKPDILLAQLTRGNCPPVLGYSSPNDRMLKFENSCSDFNDQVFAMLEAHRDQVSTVVLSAAYKVLFKEPEHTEEWLADMQQTVDQLILLGFKVVVVGPPPATGTDFARCYFIKEMRGQAKSECDYPRSAILPVHRQIMIALQALSGPAAVIDLVDTICDDSTCHTVRGETLIYRDSGHLSIEGSAWLARAAAIDRYLP